MANNYNELVSVLQIFGETAENVAFRQAFNEAANAIEELDAETKRLKDAIRNYQVFELANLKALRETVESGE